MSKAGQNTFKGINTQAKASLLLFLMNLKNQDFDSVILEDSRWEDFTLNFKSGKKIICESKDRKKTLSWSEVKKILKSIDSKSNFNKTDEILIVCRQVNKPLEANLEYLKYDFPEIKKMYIDNGFIGNLINLLTKMKFFKIENDDFLYQEALTYFAEQISYWVPENDLQMFMDFILIHKIYNNSQKGAVFTKYEFIQQINDYKKQKIKSSYAYDPDRKTLEDQLRTQLAGANDNLQRDRILNANALIAITAQPNLGFFLLEYIKKLDNVNLNEFDELWKAMLKRLYAFSTLLIFEKKLEDPNNASYIIRFLTDNYSYLSSPIRDNSNQEFAIDLVTKVFNKHPILLGNVYFFIKKVFEFRKGLFAELNQHQNIERERDLISELLFKVFIEYKNIKNIKITNEIIDIIYMNFDIVSDDSKHNLYTPNEIFSILREFIELDPENNLKVFIDRVIKQYQKRWYKNFNGWELSGGGISQSGNQFSISDRHFVIQVIKPVLLSLYDNNTEKTWQLILKLCVSRKITDVNKNRPDFLNRSIISILLREYKSGHHINEAFQILSDFIQMKKGIPWKADIIFQELNGEYLDEKKWALIKVSLDAYNNLPVNVFVEQIVSDLAQKNHKEALKILADWIKNPEYNKRQLIGSFNVMENISKLIDSNETFKEGVKIFNQYISTDSFIKKDNDWNTWDIAKVLGKIISKSPDVGINVLNKLSNLKELSLNQQILLTNSINDISKDNKILLKTVHDKFIIPFLTSLNEDIKLIEKKVTNRQAREQIVQYAEKLTEADLFDEALFIVNIFINDSDPIIGNYKDDTKDEFNQHKKIISGDDDMTIGTVRGYCAWSIQRFALLQGRKYISKAVKLVETLTKDKNYYVRLQSTIPLLELVKNRNTVLPDNDKERFIPVKLAGEIGNIAFNMLRNKTNQRLPAIMKHLAMVFSYMRNLTQKEAWEVLNIFLKDNYPKKTKQRGRGSFLADILSEAAPLYIFFAEYRKNSFKNWSKSWGSLGKFNDKPFKLLLESLIKDKNYEIRRIFTWQFARLPDEVKNTPKFKESLKLAAYYLILASKNYDHRAFENIYRFVEDYIDIDYETCINIWKKCINIEYKYFQKNYSQDKLTEMYWWPFFYNGKILLKIAEKEGILEFFNWFEKLADYPAELCIANDLDIVVDFLINITDYQDKVEVLLNRLMQRNSKYYEYKLNWIKNRTDTNDNNKKSN